MTQRCHLNYVENGNYHDDMVQIFLLKRYDDETKQMKNLSEVRFYETA